MDTSRTWASVAGLLTGVAIGAYIGVRNSRRKPEEIYTETTDTPAKPKTRFKVRQIQRAKEMADYNEIVKGYADAPKLHVVNADVKLFDSDTPVRNSAYRYGDRRRSHPSVGWSSPGVEDEEDLERALWTQPREVHDLPVRLPRGQGFGFPPDITKSWLLVIHYEDREWDWGVELERRKLLAELGRPYLITKQEFEESAEGYDVEWLYFFPAEGVLCDESYYDLGSIEDVTGPLPFGHGHPERNKVCARNETLTTDYEIECIEDESYADWVERQILIEDKQPGSRHGPGAS